MPSWPEKTATAPLPLWMPWAKTRVPWHLSTHHHGHKCQHQHNSNISMAKMQVAHLATRQVVKYAEDDNVSTASWWKMLPLKSPSVIPSKSLLDSPSVCPSEISSLLPSKSPSAIPHQVSVSLSHHLPSKSTSQTSPTTTKALWTSLSTPPLFVSSLLPWEVKGAVKPHPIQRAPDHCL